MHLARVIFPLPLLAGYRSSLAKDRNTAMQSGWLSLGAKDRSMPRYGIKLRLTSRGRILACHSGNSRVRKGCVLNLAGHHR